ncbi:MAG: protein phosphatase CheZ [Alphaproteobacteria bacterium]
MAKQEDLAFLKKAVRELFERIHTIREEIAAIRKPGTEDTDNSFSAMSDQLDAIVEATETATDTIMNNVESIETLVATARSHTTAPEATAALDQVGDKIAAVFEACAFQDITGQRVTKVVKLIKYIEERVDSLIAVWGAEALENVEVVKEQRGEYEQYLHGPQLKGLAKTQEEIDQMMGPVKATAAAVRPVPAAKPAPAAPAKSAPAPTPAPAPVVKSAPKPPPAPEPAAEAPALSQDDIDSLFN